jgi:hypothetical protein
MSNLLTFLKSAAGLVVVAIIILAATIGYVAIATTAGEIAAFIVIFFCMPVLFIYACYFFQKNKIKQSPSINNDTIEAIRQRSLVAMKKATEARQKDIQENGETRQERLVTTDAKEFNGAHSEYNTNKFSTLEMSENDDNRAVNLTDKQKTALLAASNNAYIFSKDARWHDANSSNTFNTRTLDSLVGHGLLDISGGDKYQLTNCGYDVLSGLGLNPGMEWRPDPFATLFIHYIDSSGNFSEREVEPYNFDRYRMRAYCRLRGGEPRTFSLANVTKAVDVETGEEIYDLSGWLKNRRGNRSF